MEGLFPDLDPQTPILQVLGRLVVHSMDENVQSVILGILAQLSKPHMCKHNGFYMLLPILDIDDIDPDSYAAWILEDILTSIRDTHPVEWIMKRLQAAEPESWPILAEAFIWVIKDGTQIKLWCLTPMG